MTRKPYVGYPQYGDPHAVNLTAFTPPAVYDAGYYLLSGPHVKGTKTERVGVVLAVREQNRINYARAHPPHWRAALAAFIQ